MSNYTSVSQKTIGRLLKKRNLLTTFDVDHMVDSKCIRKVQCPQVKQATFNLLTTMQKKAQLYLMIYW